MRLEGGEPLFVERGAGRGRVHVSAAAFDVRSGNLPTCRAFVPLVHSLIYDLANAGRLELNRPPQRELTVRCDDYRACSANRRRPPTRPRSSRQRRAT